MERTQRNGLSEDLSGLERTAIQEITERDPIIALRNE
jgi:hypothetical protein